VFYFANSVVVTTDNTKDRKYIEQLKLISYCASKLISFWFLTFANFI